MGAEQSRTSNNASGVHETDFVVIGSGIGGMLQTRQQNLVARLICLAGSSLLDKLVQACVVLPCLHGMDTK